MGLDPRHPHELIHRDWSVLVCHPDGAILGDDGCGLYQHECRVLSRYRLTLDGITPDWVSSRALEADSWAVSLRLARPGAGPDGPDLPQDAIEIRLARRIGSGMVERIELHNHAMTARSVALAIEVGADFADVLEVAAGQRQQSGKLDRGVDGDGIAIRYRATRGERHTERGIRLRPIAGDLQLGQSPDSGAIRASADVSLAASGSWSVTLAYEPLVDGAWRLPDGAGEGWERARAEREAWRRRRPHLRSSSPTLQTS